MEWSGTGIVGYHGPALKLLEDQRIDDIVVSSLHPVSKRLEMIFMRDVTKTLACDGCRHAVRSSGQRRCLLGR